MFTKLEKQIILFRLLTVFAWLGVVAIHTYFFSVHFVLGIFWLLFLPGWIWFFRWTNLYLPKKGYFRCYYRQHSKEDRQKLSENAELFGKYTIIGDVAFLDECIVIKKAGILLKYEDVKSVSCNKEGVNMLNRAFAYVLTFHLQGRPVKYQYRLFNDASPFVGNNCQYIHALAWIRSHRSQPPSEEKNEDDSARLE